MVVFFDIDGTLLDTGGAGGAALEHAFAEAYDIPVDKVPTIELAGAVDSGLFADLQQRLDATSKRDPHIEEITQLYLGKLRANLTSDAFSPSLYPGARGLVDHCVAHPGITTTLITGNLREGARVKLEHFGLWSSFHLEAGGFGEDATVRDDVARAGIQRALSSGLATGEPRDWWLIGDTPRDIQCARAAGVRVAAVATGGATRQALADAQPDVLLDDLSDLPRILDALGIAI